MQERKPRSFCRASSGYTGTCTPSCHSWVCCPGSHNMGVREGEVQQVAHPKLHDLGFIPSEEPRLWP